MKPKKQQNICSVCGKPYDYSLSITIIDGKETCLHDNPYIGGKSKKAQKSHINAELSKEAMRMAIEQRRIDDDMGLNEKVEVIGTQEGKNRNKGKMLKIPKKIIDSVEEKIMPLLEE